MDKKRLIGEEVPQIKQGEIDAWHRGKGDALRSKLLKASRKLSTTQAVKLVKLFAQVGDIHFLSTKFDIFPDECRAILAAFDIRSIEDARKVIASGVIAELDGAVQEQQLNDIIEAKMAHAEAQEKMDAIEAMSRQKEETVEEADQRIAVARDEAQRKNKVDHLRKLISEGIDPETGRSNFRIPLQQVTTFRTMISGGVSHLQRRFGGTAADIVSEIKRLAPHIDTDMLRP